MFEFITKFLTLNLLLILNFQLLANELTIIDVRTPQEFLFSHIEGSENMFNNNSYRVMPEVRDSILFPNSLSHVVYPFNTDDKDDERISFSFNATIIFDNEPTN